MPGEGRDPTTKFKNYYKGEDIYVLGSGASMEFINPNFFKNKLSIGANGVWKYFPVSFSVFKHRQFVKEASDAGKICIASLHDCGDTTQPINNDLFIDKDVRVKMTSTAYEEMS